VSSRQLRRTGGMVIEGAESERRPMQRHCRRLFPNEPGIPIITIDHDVKDSSYSILQTPHLGEGHRDSPCDDQQRQLDESKMLNTPVASHCPSHTVELDGRGLGSRLHDV